MTAPADPAVPAAEGRPWKRGAAWLCFLGPFFFATYGFATWTTAQRASVPVIVFEWERQIPFIAWTILPYWIIDLFYGISLVLPATRAALDAHVRRLFTAQVIAVTCFLAFPLRVSFERAPVDGAFGVMFDALAAFDKPFNQAPSLHIALLVLLWIVYVRALPRALHWPLHGLAALIGVSVLTTWQHHFIDVPTGLWLGWFCAWLFPDAGRAPFAGAAFTGDPVRRRLAFRYALAAITVAAVAIAGWGAWLWLLWGSGALALVASIYAGSGPHGFQKDATGRMSLAARWLLAPYVAGARLNARWWTRGMAPADRLAEGVLLGRLPSGRADARMRVDAVVDCTAELPLRASAEPFAGRYACVPMLDLVAPPPDAIERAVQAIEASRRHGTVLVCCALGLSRSALAAAAWLLRTGQERHVDGAIERVRAARPGVALSGTHRAALQAWLTAFAPVPAPSAHGAPR
jgi:protein-tyrosine phosphatase